MAQQSSSSLGLIPPCLEVIADAIVSYVGSKDSTMIPVSFSQADALLPEVHVNVNTRNTGTTSASVRLELVLPQQQGHETCRLTYIRSLAYTYVNYLLSSRRMGAKYVFYMHDTDRFAGFFAIILFKTYWVHVSVDMWSGSQDKEMGIHLKKYPYNRVKNSLKGCVSNIIKFPWECVLKPSEEEGISKEIRARWADYKEWEIERVMDHVSSSAATTSACSTCSRLLF